MAGSMPPLRPKLVSWRGQRLVSFYLYSAVAVPYHLFSAVAIMMLAAATVAVAVALCCYPSNGAAAIEMDHRHRCRFTGEERSIFATRIECNSEHSGGV